MSAPDESLLFVYAECGPNVTEIEFNDWYDNEHAPGRLTVPGFSNATRYKTTDGKPPSWLAIYDITSPEVISSDAYEALSAKRSETEKSIISRLTTLNRRVYNRFFTKEKPGIDISTLPAKFVLVVGLWPAPGDQEEDQNKWYKEEHLSLLSKVPGFLRARRYKLINHAELAGNTDADSSKVAYPYLTLYDWENDAFSSTAEFKEAITTPWSQKVLGAVAHEIRLFTVHKRFFK